MGVDIAGGIKMNTAGILGYSLISCAVCCSGIIFLDIKNRFVKGFLFFLLLLYLALLILMDSMSGWIILIIAALAGSYFKHRGLNRSAFAIPGLYLAVIILSIFLSFTDTAKFAESLTIGKFKESAVIFRFPQKELGFKESLNIAAASFKDNWFLGSGQATFPYNFSKNTKGILSKEQPSSLCIQAAEFDGESKWFRFNRSFSYLFDIVSNAGLLGLSSYLGLIVILFALILYILNFLEKNPAAKPAYFVIAPFLPLVLLQLFIINNITVSFLFWIFLALMMLFLKTIFPPNPGELCFTRENYHGRSFFFIFEITLAVFVIGAGVLGIIAVRYRLAEINYRKYLDAGISARDNIEKAARLNPYNETYHSALAKISLDKIKEESKKDSKDLGIMKEESVRGIEAVKKNALKHPYSASAWESQGDLYMAVMPFVKKGASVWAIKSFERAIEFEPGNTRFILELGKAYLFEGMEDGVDIAKVDKAIDYFNQVIDSCRQDELFSFDNNDMLCLDGEEARIYLSKALEAKGDSGKAIGELEEADNMDIEAMFELGRLYFNSSQLEKAADILEKAIKSSPNYSNALYTLGAVYEKMGESEKAASLHRRVADLNPENEEAMGKIEELRIKN
ncbi:hypothetical protein A2Y83_05400 [Candidatus Falkowbacteria bacterium RBG_13_39_14]|uniref:Tetratricopeptide repeat protein n=1 Tax=Candidatus Falkowbacteria bacterium RBG_13_39_14 TaxID=1797985 RepID=A0A1F5S1D4_9BACT|nr:MAG: hypothetical protein A2Y83_05400 [Candidatus Falkowbacteria bacterium RBG_13_39_14]